MLRPVICVTVHRRYTELAQNLAVARNLFQEFSLPPEVVLLAAQPERDALPFFERLKTEGLVHHVIFRPSNGLDTPVTTYPESHNIQFLLRFAKDIYGESAYVILQAADCCPNPGTYRFVDEAIQGGAVGALFHWENPLAKTNVWHTNFFAITLSNEAVWPPIAHPGEPDVLERKWGKDLDANRYFDSDWLRTHNYNQKRFLHEHLPLSPLPKVEDPLPIKRRRSRWKRWGRWLTLAAAV